MKITNAIVNHIFENLGVTLKNKVSIKNDSFLTNERIEYTDEDNNSSETLVWGCETTIESSKFIILLTEFPDNEYFLITKLENCPTYGCHLNPGGDCIVGFALNPNNWLKANVAIQANFLAGMENLKDISSGWIKLKENKSFFDELRSFVEYQGNL